MVAIALAQPDTSTRYDDGITALGAYHLAHRGKVTREYWTWVCRGACGQEYQTEVFRDREGRCWQFPGEPREDDEEEVTGRVGRCDQCRGLAVCTEREAAPMPDDHADERAELERRGVLGGDGE